jgi:hypothetical protein
MVCRRFNSDLARLRRVFVRQFQNKTRQDLPNQEVHHRPARDCAIRQIFGLNDVVGQVNFTSSRGINLYHTVIVLVHFT